MLSDRTFQIGRWTVLPELNQIQREDGVQRLEPKIMDVLTYLARSPGQVLAKEQILKAVWPDTFVGDEVLARAIGELRKALRDDAKDPAYIETIPKRGYRLIAQVTSASDLTRSRYRIEKELGRGAMGEVFLARDNLLRRNVALKFLVEELEQDDKARKRFLREARSAAALDHPYVCSVHDTGNLEGRTFIAMEYVDGRTLRERLSEGPLPMAEALQIGSEIAEALEKAHAAGIVHRDLKPANIMLTPEVHAKVMDFGLAKRLVTEDESRQDISSTVWEEGAAVGTLSYMSPEQIRGDKVDCRSDIFAFGIILYEMLTGQHPFRRIQSVETAAVILKEDPPPLESDLAGLPELLRHTVYKMLAKDPGERYQSVHEVLTNLNQLKGAPGKAGLVRRQRKRTVPSWMWITACVALGSAIGFVAVWALWIRPDADTTKVSVIRSSIMLPEGERLASVQNHAVAVSPDGRWVAYTSYRVGEDYESDGEPVINLRRMDQDEPRRIPGFGPFFSPDSSHLGFVESGQGVFSVKRTAVEGGAVELVAQFEESPSGIGGFGCAWLPNRTIVVAPREAEGLFAVAAVGGDPKPLTQLDEAGGEIAHRLPSPLPDGRTILYTTIEDGLNWSLARIVAERIDTGERKVLIQGGSDGRYIDYGHLLFAREGRLMAVRFDPVRLEVEGDPVPVLDRLVHSIHYGTTGIETGAAQYSVSQEGLLVFGPGSVWPESMNTVVWVDREGREERLDLELRQWSSARISADARYVLLSNSYPPNRVWLYDLERKTMRPQTFFEGSALWAIWDPGSTEFTFTRGRKGPSGIYIKSIDSGPGAGEKLETGFFDDVHPSSWHRDGKRLAFVGHPTESADILIFDRQEGVGAFLQTRFNERYPEFSPDGQWLCYVSDQSESREVYVRPFPSQGRLVQISTAGGEEPCWSRGGQEIFYSRVDPSLQHRVYYAVRITVDGGELKADLPQRLFSGPYVRTSPVRSYDVGPGERFLLIKGDPNQRRRDQEAMAPMRIELVANWFEELRVRVPAE